MGLLTIWGVCTVVNIGFYLEEHWVYKQTLKCSCGCSKMHHIPHQVKSELDELAVVCCHTLKLRPWIMILGMKDDKVGRCCSLTTRKPKPWSFSETCTHWSARFYKISVRTISVTSNSSAFPSESDQWLTAYTGSTSCVLLYAHTMQFIQFSLRFFVLLLQ